MKNNKAFTLVELIVVITILAVLATVAFISFQGYAASSRDSVRLADMKSIQKVISIFKQTQGNYPLPNDNTNITYSGATAWSQGIFGTNSYSDSISMGNVPTDPLTFLPYSYSVTNTRQEYQIATVLENSTANVYTPQTYAGEQIANVYVKGDYNGKFLKVHTGSLDYLLGVPSILSSDITSVDLMDIVSTQRLVYKGYNNLPASYSESVYNNNGGFAFTPNKILLFEGDINDFQNNPIVRLDFLDNLETSYSGTIISTETGIAEILNIKSGSVSVADNYISNLLNNTLNTNISLEGQINQSTPGLTGDIFHNVFKLLEAKKTAGNPLAIEEPHLPNLVLVNGRVIFISDQRLWSSDGTEAGTIMLSPAKVGLKYYTNLYKVNNKVYLYGEDLSGEDGINVRSTDGTVAGTGIVNNGNTCSNGLRDGYLSDMFVLQSKIYFEVDYYEYGSEFCSLDTGTGLITLHDVFSGSESSNPRDFALLNNKIYFGGTLNNAVGRELLYLDLSTGTINLAFEMRPGSDSSHPGSIISANNKLFFSAINTSGSYKTWASDGTSVGTVEVHDNITFMSSAPSLNGKIYFSANTSTKGIEYIESDGTTAGSKIFADIYPNSGSSSPSTLGILGNNLFFAADNGVNGRELYKTDGVTYNLVKDIKIPGSSNPGEGTIFNGKIYFSANNGVGVSQIWSSDGTEAGTNVVTNEANYMGKSVVYNGTIYFPNESVLKYIDSDGIVQEYKIAISQGSGG